MPKKVPNRDMSGLFKVMDEEAKKKAARVKAETKPTNLNKIRILNQELFDGIMDMLGAFQELKKKIMEVTRLQRSVDWALYGEYFDQFDEQGRRKEGKYKGRKK
mgnify:CR=1 FL=1